MKLFLAVLAGVFGAGAGFLTGLMASFPLASLFGITGFEGASGFFAVYLGLAVGIVGFVAGLSLPFILSRKRTSG